jgi:hypothetical protein
MPRRLFIIRIPDNRGWRTRAQLSTISHMRTFPACLMIPVLLLGVSGCASSYDPPVQGDRTSDRYKTDLDKCRTSSAETVRRQNAATPATWIASPFTGPPKVRAEIRSCMEHKGYNAES